MIYIDFNYRTISDFYPDFYPDFLLYRTTYIDFKYRKAYLIVVKELYLYI